MSHTLTQHDSVTVSGVVDAKGSAGVDIRGKGWTLRFAFDTWRSPDGRLHSEKLSVTRTVSQDELHHLRERIYAYNLLTARVVFTGAADAELLELIDQAVSDDALVRRAEAMKQPQTREHATFGTLSFDPRLDWYQGRASWAGSPVGLNLSAMIDSELEAALRVAAELWQDQAGWNQRVQDYAVQKLLDLKNSAWLDDGESALNAGAFKARMSLNTITVYPNGEFEFWHDDGDLFFGHTILVSGSLAAGPTDADIPG